MLLSAVLTLLRKVIETSTELFAMVVRCLHSILDDEI